MVKIYAIPLLFIALVAGIIALVMHNYNKNSLYNKYNNIYNPTEYFGINVARPLIMPRIMMAGYDHIYMIAQIDKTGVFGEKDGKIQHYIIAEDINGSFKININNICVANTKNDLIAIKDCKETKALINAVYLHFVNSSPKLSSKKYTQEGFYSSWAYVGALRLNDIANNLVMETVDFIGNENELDDRCVPIGECAPGAEKTRRWWLDGVRQLEAERTARSIQRRGNRGTSFKFVSGIGSVISGNSVTGFGDAHLIDF